MNGARWTWSFRKGMGWALPVTVGALLGVKNVLAIAIAFHNDYSPLLLVFLSMGLALWLGGLRRIAAEAAREEADLRDRVAGLGKSGGRPPSKEE